MASLRRFAKQLIFGSVFLAVLAGVVAWIWYTTLPKPSCFDSIRNQNEEGVDCGGVCAVLCTKEPVFRTVNVLGAQLFETNPAMYDVLGEIENKNADFGSPSFAYEFSLLDASGTALTARRGNSYILPREKKFVVEQRLVLPADKVILKAASATLRIFDERWVEVGVLENISIAVRNKELSPLSGAGAERAWRASGVAVNGTGYDLERVDIMIIVRADNGAPIAVGSTDVRVLKSGEQRAFEVRWPGDFSRPAARLDIETHTNLLADENFLARYGKGRERFQEEFPILPTDRRRR